MPPTREQVQFFEQTIRPILEQNCYECHSSKASRLKGGLSVETREAMLAGGQTGPSLIPGDPDRSLLVTACRQTNKDLQMPPDGQLSAAQLADLETWVRSGAPHPSQLLKHSNQPSTTNFWAFQPVKAPQLPKVRNRKWAGSPVDLFVLSELEQRRLQPAPAATKAKLIRRVTFDLTGLPPTSPEVEAFMQDSSTNAFAKVVDRLLESSAFGERWGRHWLDVVRYADNNDQQLPIFFTEAWRYRDYVIASFNADKPFNQFLTEQLAGDILAKSDRVRHDELLIATGFLMLGPKNFVQPDQEKAQLDVIDEQIDVTTRAFLGLTVACARCHDHKFDPVPTRDYYALAGIFASTATLSDQTGARGIPWMEQSIGAADEVERFEKHQKELERLTSDLATSRERRQRLPGGIEASELEGVVVDNLKAEVTGTWRSSNYATNFVDKDYVQDANEGKGKKSIRFVPTLTEPGLYEIRMTYEARPNRATNVPVVIEVGGLKRRLTINQRETPPVEGLFASLGTYELPSGTNTSVTISTEGTKGFVMVDAVQFLPMSQGMGMMAKPMVSEKAMGAANRANMRPDDIAMMDALDDLRMKAPPKPPSVMAPREGAVKNANLRIRGEPERKGELVPRSTLSVLAKSVPSPVFKDDSSGRLELAQWMTSASNPLTPRVYANRVWLHLFGRPLVSSPDNFGRMTAAPTHPELLDLLASRLVEGGWSTKRLIRELVLSSTYQMSTDWNAKAAARDPDNTFWWRMNRRRLDAEGLRDSFLAVSGLLDRSAGGSSLGAVTPGLNPAAINSITNIEQNVRRSVYLPVLRGQLPELLQAFDFPDPQLVAGARYVSTSAPQALFLMNSGFMQQVSQGWAASLGASADAVTTAYGQAFGRTPTEAEAKAARDFLLRAGGQSKDALSLLCQALMSSNEWQYLE